MFYVGAQQQSGRRQPIAGTSARRLPAATTAASIALATWAECYLCAACARLSIKYANYANYAALLDLFVALFDRQVVATLPLRIRNSVWAWHSAIAPVLSNSHSTRMNMIYTLSTDLAPSHDTRFMRQ